MCIYDWNMTLNMVKRVINLEPLSYKEGYDILEVDSRSCVLIMRMMDLEIGWLERHETNINKVIELSLFTIGLKT